MVTLERVLERENMQQAIEYLRLKKNACGDDGVWLHGLEEYWEWNGDTIRGQIQREEYYPQIIHDRMILTGVGKRRIISHMSSVDRLLVRAIYQEMLQWTEARFSKFSFAYQSGKGTTAAVQCAANFISEGKKYVVELDVKDFFDSILHDKLMPMLNGYVEDRKLLILLERYIVCKVEYDCNVRTKTKGLLQGNSLSPMLSNIYMTEFDFWMEEQNCSFVRFADNINVYVNSLQEGYDILHKVEQKLKEYGLEIKPEKKGVYPVVSRKYLGYSFEKADGNVIIQKNARKNRYWYKTWHKSAIEKMDHDYYIVNDGVLTKSDFSILFENEENRVSIPVETTNSINIYSDVVLSSNFLKLISKNKLSVNIFDTFGNYIGSFYSAQQRNRMEMLVTQVQIYADASKRLQYAKTIDIASIHNLRCNLKYYYKQQNSSVLEEGISYFSKAIKEMNEAPSIEKVLLIEGRCRQKYYRYVNQMIHNEDFVMTERTKRPPKDAINSLFSFGNTCLYQRISQIIHRTSVDVRISFVHSAMKRYENLNLDIADIFKPIIVDRVIFSLINKKRIHAVRHFVQENGGVFLNTEGKRLFISEFEEKMQQVITIGNQPYTYERLIMNEIKKLGKSFLGEEVYKAYKHQN